LKLIFQPFILSIGVAARMIMPLFVIAIASMLVWTILGVLSLGLTNYISTPVTMTFISLYGMRIALEQSGERTLVDIRLLATYSVVFGILLEVIEFIALYVVGTIAVLAAQWQTGFSLADVKLQSAEESIILAFSLSTISFYAIFGLLTFVAIQVVFAVPMAAAAQSAGHGSKGNDFLEGFGSSFFALFPVYLLSFFVQFFFGLYLLIILFFGAFLLGLTRMIDTIAEMFQSEERIGMELFSAIDPSVFLTSIASLFGLIWLQALVWSGAALALKKHQGRPAKVSKAKQQKAQAPQIDIRALRKSREKQRNQLFLTLLKVCS